MIQMTSLRTAAKNIVYYYNDPVSFAYDIIGSRHTGYQQEILYGLADNKNIAWRSSHGLGKTYTAADAALWFLFTRYNSRVITTASLWRQVKLLWNEIGYKIKGMKLNTLNIDKSKIDINLGIIRISPSWYASGMASNEPEKLEGQHAEDILFIIDEAKLVSYGVFKSIRGALTSTGAKLLVISTPSENNEGYFYDIWKDDLNFVKFHTSAFESPNIKKGRIVVPHLVTQEWVDECKEDWGEDSPTYITKVLGDFPDITEDTLIPYRWVENALKNNYDKSTPIEVSCDVARYGSDVTVIMERQGRRARISKVMSKRDTMEVAGAVKFIYNKLKATKAKIDVIGVGSGVCDRLREQRVSVMDCNNAEKAIDSENFLNARAENYWHLRTIFKEGDIDIEHNKFLIQELTAIKYKYHSSGRIMVESKDDIRKRLNRSPDYADALSYLFAPKRYGDVNSFSSVEKEILVSSW